MVRVFPSSSDFSTLVVWEEEGGCAQEGWGDTPIPSDCINLRGGLFSMTNSTTWTDNAPDSGKPITITTDNVTGGTVSADLGYDTLTFPGSKETTLNDQLISAFVISQPIFGLFGLQPTTLHFTDTVFAQSAMQNLRNQSLIPSMSWGYTAGRSYSKFREVS